MMQNRFAHFPYTLSCMLLGANITPLTYFKVNSNATRRKCDQFLLGFVKIHLTLHVDRLMLQSRTDVVFRRA